MPANIHIKKGLNIKLAGEPGKELSTALLPDVFALQPLDFIGINPRLLIQAGDEVFAGTPLFHDKNNEAIKFCSPVSGEIIDIVRGDKRVIQEVRILADKETRFVDFQKKNPADLTSEEIITSLLESGAWPFIRQRPFATIANPKDKPKSIFISAFDTNPLAPDLSFIFGNKDETFQTGLDALQKLTDGSVHLNIHSGTETASVFSNARGVVINRFSGPHPSGNIGVQINHIDPLNKGEVIWNLGPQEVLIIGRLFATGRFDARKVMVVAGSQVEHPKYYATIVGCSVKPFLEDAGVKEGLNRVISGSVLSGQQIDPGGYLGFYDSQVNVIPEGKDFEFMGWLAPGFNKFSVSRTFFSWMNGSKQHLLNTNLHGEERPFVVTGEYEKVFPMNIYPVQLLKSILIEDIELMEKLGIYEVVEEDFALCEVICTSKIKSQAIIRRGLEIIRKEFS